jgi:hypothetical protein
MPGFNTPTKAIRNDGAGHHDGGPDAEGTEAISDPDVEKEFNKPTGKKRNYNAYLKIRAVKDWLTEEDALSEEAEIEHQIYNKMKEF